ncbi:hypothetical protein HDU82_002186 [Entophlyctis luteolus]|nr:hypothetical protein HDU82_002186 [Entophlyctis luteolus]
MHAFPFGPVPVPVPGPASASASDDLRDCPQHLLGAGDSDPATNQIHTYHSSDSWHNFSSTFSSMMENKDIGLPMLHPNHSQIGHFHHPLQYFSNPAISAMSTTLATSPPLPEFPDLSASPIEPLDCQLWSPGFPSPSSSLSDALPESNMALVQKCHSIAPSTFFATAMPHDGSPSMAPSVLFNDNHQSSINAFGWPESLEVQNEFHVFEPAFSPSLSPIPLTKAEQEESGHIALPDSPLSTVFKESPSPHPQPQNLELLATTQSIALPETSPVSDSEVTDIEPMEQMRVGSSSSVRKGRSGNPSRKPSATKSYACPYDGCDKTFPRQYNLKSHMFCHSGLRPHVCCLCNAAFARKHDLQRHSRTIHAKERPFKCATCSQGFSQIEQLRRHEIQEKAGLAVFAGMKPTLKSPKNGKSKAVQSDGEYRG